MVKNMPANAGDAGSCQKDPLYCRRKWQPDPVFLPGKSHGQSSLEGYIHEVAELDTTEQLDHHHHHRHHAKSVLYIAIIDYILPFMMAIPFAKVLCSLAPLILFFSRNLKSLSLISHKIYIFISLCKFGG